MILYALVLRCAQDDKRVEDTPTIPRELAHYGCAPISKFTVESARRY
jgi:hypothetical protein